MRSLTFYLAAPSFCKIKFSPAFFKRRWFPKAKPLGARRSGRNPHIIIFHKIVPAQSPRPRRQELRYRQRCLPEKMARDESAIRLRGTGLHWAEAPRRRMKSSAETLSYPYPVWPPKLYANVQLWQSKFCVQRVDERERRFAVSSGCCEQSRERTGRGASLSPSRGLSFYSRKIFHRKVFRGCGETGVSWKPFLLQKVSRS